MRKTGSVAIVGLANAGKSTLMNALVQQKVSIVSPKPQTTRDSILGIWTDEDSQIVFVDTPIFQKQKRAGRLYAQKHRQRRVRRGLRAGGNRRARRIDDKEISQITRHAKRGSPIVVAVTKIDITQPQALMPQLAKLNSIAEIKEVYCVSARKNKGVEQLREALKKYLTGDVMYFEEDDVTDRSRRYMVSEIIREKVLLACDEEIPHGVGVAINKMQREDGVWDIDATVLVEKASHKPIVLAKTAAK